MPEGTLREAVNLSEDWMVLVFLFTLVSLAYTRRVHPARIFRLWNSMWNIRTMRQTIREEPNTPRANLLFNSVFYLQAEVQYHYLRERIQRLQIPPPDNQSISPWF
jgi:hypothetical protein